MKQERNNRAYYDAFSLGYETERGRGYHGMLDDLEVQSVAALARGARVLEAGCGTGLILDRLRAVAAEAVGIDLSAGMLQRARARGLPVAQAGVGALPFEDGAFDLVCSFKVLAHVQDIDSALRELARVTRVGGHVALEFYNPLSLRYVAKRAAGPQPISDDRTEADVFTRWDRPDQVRALLPPQLDLIDLVGVRVLTPAAAFHRLPFVSRGLRWAEARAMYSPLRYFGGFLIAIAEKKSRR